jgi:hypothetical protein
MANKNRDFRNRYRLKKTKANPDSDPGSESYSYWYTPRLMQQFFTIEQFLVYLLIGFWQNRFRGHLFNYRLPFGERISRLNGL